MLEAALAILFGGFVGFSLGLIGGGGSILAVPLLIYGVGVASPHAAIGTSAAAVALNAFANLVPHSRAGNVRWASALPFAVVGVAGAVAGSTFGKLVDGQQLLFLFAILMIVVAGLMLRRGHGAAQPERSRHAALLRLSAVALGTGLLAGFFGIGGGFLIVPGLIFATGMPILEAIGSSLVSVGAFGVTTAANYALSDLVIWTLVLEFLAGGVLGGWLGKSLAMRLGKGKATLTYAYAGIIVVVAIYMLYRSAGALGLI
ncbi:MAG: sulfite exporter TauE/SafE family protein [Rhodospirillaceae bacterium]|nr:sulfite exporter TauE/SafE family protein [Rhodospirillaceae bacterium]